MIAATLWFQAGSAGAQQSEPSGAIQLAGGIRFASGSGADHLAPGPRVSLAFFAPQRGHLRAGLVVSRSSQSGRRYPPDVVTPPAVAYPDLAVTSIEIALQRAFDVAEVSPFLGLGSGLHWLRQSDSPIAQRAQAWGVAAEAGLRFPVNRLEFFLAGGYEIVFSEMVAREGDITRMLRLSIGIEM